jgi:hypothetical protein
VFRSNFASAQFITVSFHISGLLKVWLSASSTPPSLLSLEFGCCFAMTSSKQHQFNSASIAARAKVAFSVLRSLILKF